MNQYQGEITVVAPQARRMSIGSIVRGPVVKPLRLTLYAGDGVGKTTFASRAPDPVFLCAESGTAQLDVARLPEPQTWTDVLDAVRMLTVEDHGFKTFVLDSLDWAEPLAWAHVCAQAGKKDIESFGYGKGYVAALDAWSELLALLERMQAGRGMGIILLAHAQITTVPNPEDQDYLQWNLKLHKAAAARVREWSDVVSFAQVRLFTTSKDKKPAKGSTDGARVMQCHPSPAWNAKNRYSLPPELPLDWDAFDAALKAHEPGKVETLRARVASLLAQVTDEKVREGAAFAAGRAKDNAGELARIADKLAAMIGIANKETES